MLNFWKHDPILLEELTKVRSYIQDSITHAHEYVRDLLATTLFASGKMLRPALALISSELGKSEQHEAVIRIAAVLEMVHMASLIHDDIIDGAQLRRGFATLHAQAGIKQAVLAGDYLLSKALTLIENKEGDLEASAVAKAFSRLCESELEQDGGAGDFSISIDTYLRRIAGKTASLFALSCYAGAAVAQGSCSDQKRMHHIGYLLGMAFQIEDDILDYQGTTHTLGKQTNRDLLCGIPTLPVIEALEVEKQQSEHNRPLATLLSKKRLSKKDAHKAVALTIELGGVTLSQALAKEYVERAHKQIALLSEQSVQDKLLSLLDQLTDRSK